MTSSHICGPDHEPPVQDAGCAGPPLPALDVVHGEGAGPLQRVDEELLHHAHPRPPAPPPHQAAGQQPGSEHSQLYKIFIQYDV